jgi:TolB protein
LSPTFSPTENLIAFQRADSQSGFYSIWTIDEVGIAETQIISSTEEGYFAPTWAPDGEKLVFASGGKKIRRTPPSSQQDKPIAINQLVETRGADIWTINIDGTDLTQLTTHKADDFSPTWSRDGRIFFTSERDGYTNIWSVLPEFVDLRSPPAEVKPGTAGE